MKSDECLLWMVREMRVFQSLAFGGLGWRDPDAKGYMWVRPRARKPFNAARLPSSW
ncbi:hypothetical protein FOMPIDRAFT_1024856 [Fomitopsis schrenkii]|uniref:Uncharacterized protein n=1 Tax=Fomitopsis schrenkii TaxID=2126942 RepID=S8DY21_FOMSC|nr:hypothetical protein FOMPIDRAFT_1024856 [Fomitopsis schrenkii]